MKVICQNGTAILIKFETLDELEYYIKVIYYSSQRHKTLYFQMQFNSIRCANNLKESIKSKLILNRPKKIIAMKQEPENSKVHEMQ